MSNSETRKYKLFYFDGRGRAEPTRYNFAYACVPFTDVRVAAEDWATKVKPSSPLGQMPFLQITEPDGTVFTLSQSCTLVRQTARWFGLLGKTARERAAADEAFEILRDVGEAFGKAAFEKDEDIKSTLFATFINDVIPKNLGYLEKRFQGHANKSLTGSEDLTYADLTLACYLDMFERAKAFDYDAVIISKYPGLSSIRKAVESAPSVAAYLQKRPVTPW